MCPEIFPRESEHLLVTFLGVAERKFACEYKVKWIPGFLLALITGENGSAAIILEVLLQF